MSIEGREFDKKSLRALTEAGDKGVRELVKDCVAFANASGGRIVIGIEDDAEAPPPDQRVDEVWIERLPKRIGQLTINVTIAARKAAADQGGEFIDLEVFPSPGVAATSDGRYFIRIADESVPLMPGDLARLMGDRSAFAWESQIGANHPSGRFAPEKRRAFLDSIRASERVSAFVRQKPDDELLDHYQMTREGRLTNLGILWIGRREERALLSHAPVVQCLKFDEHGRKVNKWVWDDYTLNPCELIEAVWREVPEWRESYELPDGMFRATVPHYDEVVVREVLANALVHRPYTMGGDIFLNLYPDRLEVHNPGRLPLGVTPRNILHQTVQRNPHLAKVFHDLKLMEREGSGYDRMYEVLLRTGRPAPEVREGDDRVTVTIRKQISKPEIVEFMIKAGERFQPNQREIIALGVLAQNEAMTGQDWAQALNLRALDELKVWMGRLKDWGLVDSQGRTKGTEYFVNPKVLRDLKFAGKTSLRGIEDHRLRELVITDLSIYGESSRSEIHGRIGREIAEAKLRRILRALVEEGVAGSQGEKRWRKYRLLSKTG